MEKSKQRLDIFMEVFGFNAEDLAANQDQKLSPKQIEGLTSSFEGYYQTYPGFFLSLAVAWSGLVAIAAFSAGVNQSAIKSFISFTLPVYVFLFLLIRYGNWQRKRFYRSLDRILYHDPIKALCGRNTRQARRDAAGIQGVYFITIDNYTFQVSYEQFLTFRSDEVYCINFVTIAGHVIILSVTQEENNEREKLEHSLNSFMQHFEFTAEELATNQQGKISEQQADDLVYLYQQGATQFYGQMFLFVFLFGCIGVWMRGLPAEGDAAWREFSNVLCGSVILLPLSGFIWRFTKKVGYRRLIKHENVVESVCGIVVQRQGDYSVSVQIENKRFPVTQDQFWVFQNGEPYCIYYFSPLNRILSVRPQVKVE